MSTYTVRDVLRYSGPSKSLRLLYVCGRSSGAPKQTKVDALCLLRESLVNDTLNVHMYKATFARGKEIEDDVVDAADQRCPVDEDWVRETTEKASTQLRLLESNLQHSKTTLQKSHILSTYRSLAAHHLSAGSTVDALKCYLRSRDFVGGVSEMGTMCLDVVTTSVHLRNYQHVAGYCTKFERTGDMKDVVVEAKIKCCKGLALMSEGKYREAGSCFAYLPPATVLGDHFSSVLLADDVALYGSLLCLATMPRSTLSSLTSSPSFKSYLSLLPHASDALTSFCKCKYGPCLASISAMRDRMLYDAHLGPHAAKLIGMVREKCVVSYFGPYSDCRLSSIAETVGITVDEAEEVCARLARSGDLRARLDLRAGVLREVGGGSKPGRKARDLAEDFLVQSEATMMRMSLLKAGFLG
eukprot:CAMPEP_0182452894 /NCGR_PEP_ID=MMETSP1319-20130603/192_1 /TAXON_ID=172717 /ORGANISM="Bolidomonas pacifica, Strain RCC208" /LENGTH=412 /DNA_ID=CAMNT_0024650775 /DNA_START=46 /DNA_END=1280 /DNA_ORIENTATION=+